jgi:hypothetical protein
MSKITDQADAGTLERIGRRPGSKRTDTFIVKAAVTRLINSGMVIPPSTTGRLYLTEAGTEAHWQPQARPVQGNGWTSAAPLACGLDGCDCHLVAAPVVLDGRFGRGVTHACSGMWSPPLGRNAGGHDVHQCDGTTTHRYIGAHRAAGHQCAAVCALAEVTPALATS